MESAKLGKLLSVGVGAKGFVLAWSPGRAGGVGMRFGGNSLRRESGCRKIRIG